mmetsp:Transcript_23038/g.33719  ORF Transcript_23038/g.33719 Transcript_23038/m.33719 type:complete len:306 (+) Transcript_23038:47-964(+)
MALIAEINAESVSEAIHGPETTIVFTTATWKKKSKQLLSDVMSASFDDNVRIVAIPVDEDGMDELALSLGLHDIPTVRIYGAGGRLISSLSPENASIDSIHAMLKSPPLPSCCQEVPDDDVYKLVSSSYASTLQGTASCCVSVDSTLNGYSAEDLKTVETANLGLGCGNPLLFADLKEGETVVDLGSGAGIDCFLAGTKVGSTGRVIGIDMTPEMVYKARQNAKENNHTNVSFRLGEIEYLPLADNSADVVISNCVINLSPDKQQVFRDMFRVLRPGGRLAICDVIKRENMILPESLRTAQALAC